MNGSAYVIIEESKYFGSTFHVMSNVIDSDGYFDSDYFEIKGNETSYEIIVESKLRSIHLVLKLVKLILFQKQIPKIMEVKKEFKFSIKVNQRNIEL